MPKDNIKNQHARNAETVASQDIEKVALKFKNDLILDRWETAFFLNTNIRALEEATKAGKIKSIKQGTRVFYLPAEVQAYIDHLAGKEVA